MTYPTVSHLIESLIGVFIPLPIQTFGLFIVLAFIAGAYFIKAGFLKLEKAKILKPISITNQKTKLEIFFDYFINGLMAFIFGSRRYLESFRTIPEESIKTPFTWTRAISLFEFLKLSFTRPLITAATKKNTNMFIQELESTCS